ncbi:MAG: carbamate kinase [Clostridiales bacterium]|nr:carbamate kinase [Clostridiales bacterium]
MQVVRRLVLALGGNALGNSPQEQQALVKDTAKTIVDLMESGYEVAIGHGNGPQIGMINLAMDLASMHDCSMPYMPFPECGAMSQGYIGYHLQQAIRQEMKRRGIQKEVASIITQVVVREDDPAFQKPVKPIGRFYTKEEAQRQAQEKGFAFAEDSGRGYRRVVASPTPQSIVELPVVRQLVEQGNVVITVGGGGIPVIETEQGYQGVAAVIDKDKSSAKLAQDLEAEMLVILTAVEQVCIHYNKPEQTALSAMTAAQAEQYIAEGHFAPGSMLPKVEACLSFVRFNPKGKALITSLQKAKEALEGRTGTVITFS